MESCVEEMRRFWLEAASYVPQYSSTSTLGYRRSSSLWEIASVAWVLARGCANEVDMGCLGVVTRGGDRLIDVVVRRASAGV